MTQAFRKPSTRIASETLALQKKQQAEADAKEKLLKKQQDASLRMRRNSGVQSLISDESVSSTRKTLG